jgi:hypothetical protein
MIAQGPGFGRSWLESASTHRKGYAQLIDIAPTVISVLRSTTPDSVVGRSLRATGSRGDAGGNTAEDLASTVPRLADADRSAVRQQQLVTGYFVFLTVTQLVLYALATAVFLLRRKARRSGNPVLGNRFVRGRYMEIAALLTASIVPATYLAQLAPWWRTSVPALVLAVLVSVFCVLVTAVACLGPWRRTPTGPLIVVSLFGALVPGVDVLTGSHLQLEAVPGYSALVAGRFTGMGNLAFAIFSTAVLIGAGCVATATRDHRRRGLIVGLITGTAVLVVAAPFWGGDVGGLVALSAAALVATNRAGGVRASTVRAITAMAFTVAALVAFSLYDATRPEQNRTHLGRFVNQLGDGTAGAVIARKAGTNLQLLVTSPLSLLAVAALVFAGAVLMRPVGGLRRVLGVYPTLRAGFTGVLLASFIGFGLNDSGIAGPALAATVAVPLAIVAALRVSLHGRPTAGSVAGPRPESVLFSAAPPASVTGTSAAAPSGAGA